MPSDVWGRDTSILLGGIIPGEKVKIALTENGLTKVTGLIASNAQIGAVRRVGQLFNLLEGKIYLYLGLPDPVQVAINGLIADDDEYSAFINSIGNACQTGTQIELTVTIPGCTSPPDQVKYIVHHPIVVSITNSVSSENLMFVGNINLVGSALEVVNVTA